MSVSFQWTITPSGSTGSDGKAVITRLLYNLIASDDAGAKGDLGTTPGIVYLNAPLAADGITPKMLADLVAERLGPDNIAVYKRIAENNLASFKGETVTVDC